jgi:hypothetical protein
MSAHLRAARIVGSALVIAIVALAAYLVLREPDLSIDAGYRDGEVERRLYVATSGQIEVYDIDEDHAYRGRLAIEASDKFKGIGASVPLGALYVTSDEREELICIDLVSHGIRWRRKHGRYPDSFAVAPDGRSLWLPLRKGEKWRWLHLDAATGEALADFEIPKSKKDRRYSRGEKRDHDGPPWTGSSGPHNTVMSANGERVYLEAMTVPYVYVAERESARRLGRIGPFSAGVRPFAVARDERFLYACVDGVLGFEVAELVLDGAPGDGSGEDDPADDDAPRGARSKRWPSLGTRIHTVELQPTAERVKALGRVEEWAHNTPSHGIGLRPSSSELWVVDGIHGELHVFDAAASPPTWLARVPLYERIGERGDRVQPGWISFAIDGRYVYSGTGHVIDAEARRVVARIAPSERLIEIQFADGKPIAAASR